MRPLSVIILLTLFACGGGEYIDMVPDRPFELIENFDGIAAADMNGDGFNDLIVGSSLVKNRQLLDSRIAIYLQRATAPGTFLPPTHHEYDAAGAQATVLAVSDLQLDGLPDIVGTSWDEGGFRTLLNDQVRPGALLAPVHYAHGSAYTTFGRPQAIGDIDQDGFPDVILVNADSVSWCPQDGSNLGIFQDAIGIGSGMTDVVVDDVSGDGLADVVVLEGDDDIARSLLVYRNNPNSPGQFVVPLEFTLPVFGDYLGLGDFDGNGWTDIAVAGSEPHSNDYSFHGALVIFRQFAGGQFVPTATAQTGGSGITDSFLVADLNDNSFSEIVFLIVPAEPGQLTVRIMGGGRSSVPFIIQDILVPEGDLPGAYPNAALAISDLNNDTLPDIAVVSRQIYVFMQNPGLPGTFGSATQISTPP